jgi:hypothetical protein
MCFFSKNSSLWQKKILKNKKEGKNAMGLRKYSPYLLACL